MRRLIFLIAISFAASTAAEEVSTFDIYEYQVEGNTVLPVGKVEEAVYPHLGESKSVEDAEKARAALEKTFHDAGYLTVFVNIPEQKVDGGVVRLEVTEGQIEKLRVVGSRYYSLGVIKERVPEFAEGKVPHFPEAQKQLAAVNNTADRQVAPVLRPGKTPGKVEVDLKVDDKLPFHGGVELNNRYVANTTRTRLNGSMRYDNLWQRDHSLGISFQVAPENTDDAKVFAATYMIPTNGDFWAFYGVVSKSDVAAAGDVNVVGNGKIFGLRYIHPLPAVDTYTHSLTLGVDYKDFKESTELQGADSFNTPIAYTPFYVGYDGTLLGVDRTTQMTLGVTFSVRGLGNDEQEFADRRFLAKPNFVYLRGEVKHTEKFAGWELSGNLNGQIASQPLIANEQFFVGGVDSVRGYLESNALGDYGFSGGLELRTPSLAKYFGDQITELRMLAFYDAGDVGILEALPGQTESFRLKSTGLGLRVKTLRGLSANLDYAMAVRDVPPVERGDDLLHFRIAYDW